MIARSASYLERGAEILSILFGSCVAAGIDEEGRAPKRKQPSLFKKAKLGRRCLLTRTML